MPLLVRLLVSLVLIGWTTVAAIAEGAPAQTAQGAVATPPTAAAPASSEAAAEALVRILSDEAGRQRLIEELRRIAEPTPAAAPGAGGATPAAPSVGTPPASPATPPPAAPDAPQAAPGLPSLADDLSHYTQQIAADGWDIAVKVWRGLANLGRLLDGTAEIDWSALSQRLVSLGILALVLAAVHYACRWLAEWPVAALARRLDGQSPPRRSLGLLAALVLDLLALAVAVIAAVAFQTGYSPTHRIEPIEGFLINAFVLTELVKIVLRAAFAPGRPVLRLLPIADETTRYWYPRLSLLVGFLVYGVMLVFPLANATIGFAVGIGVRLAIVLLTLAAALLLVARNRTRVRDGLIAGAATVRGRALAAGLALAAHAWHLLVIAYLLIAFALWVTRPFDAVGTMARGTIETLVIILVGGGSMALLSRAIADGVRLPLEVKRALPHLEERLNLLVPTFLRLVRMLMLVAVAAAATQAWGLVDVTGWIASDEGAGFVGRVATALFIVLAAMAIWIVATSWIEYRLNPGSGRAATPRTRTLLSLFRNAFSILVFVIATMLALSELGVDIAPLLAGAGVVGLAVGFGSQKLVQDIITGAFIQFENAMNEGDVVTVAGISGVVDRLTIRCVGIRDVNGVYHVIPFSSVDTVSNAMRGYAFHVADVAVAYREDIEKVKRLMGTAFERLMATEHGASILEPLEMNGVIQVVNNTLVVRARIKTLPGQQWAVGRAYNELVKQVFDENGVAMPFPQATLWLGEGVEEAGHRPPAAEDEEAGHRERRRRRHAPATSSSPGRRRRRPLETVDVPDSPERKEDDDGDDGATR